MLETKIRKTFVAYTKDLTVIVNGESRKELEMKGQLITNRREEWYRVAKLQISTRKTEAILLRGDLIRKAAIGRREGAHPDRKRKAVRAKKSNLVSRPPTIRLGYTNVEFKITVKYLGIYCDINFWEFQLTV